MGNLEEQQLMLTFSLYTSLLRTHAQKVIWGPFGMNAALGSLGIYRWHLYVASPTYVSCVALRTPHWAQEGEPQRLQAWLLPAQAPASLPGPV